jgi:hypothetical protein
MDVQGEGGLAKRGEGVGLGLEVHHAEETADGGGSQDADERGAAHLPSRQADDQREAQKGQGQGRGRGLEVSQGHAGGGVAHHDPGVAQADQGDEEADTSGDRGKQVRRYGGGNHLTHPGHDLGSR